MVLAGFATFMFGGVAIIGVMWIADVLFRIPPSIYGLCGCIRACSEKKLSVGAAVALSILHFIFVLDVVAAVVGFWNTGITAETDCINAIFMSNKT